MTGTMLTQFLTGMITLGFLVSSLFFLRFWKDTREGLFGAFALAFLLLGVAQALLALANVPVEERSWIFLIRLVAFLLIALAILRKNRAR